MVKRLVYYFDEPGEGNTQLVIEAVGQRLEALQRTSPLSLAAEEPNPSVC
jgi:hypothetical protein